jgi:hypothetical protein
MSCVTESVDLSAAIFLLNKAKRKMWRFIIYHLYYSLRCILSATRLFFSAAYLAQQTCSCWYNSTKKILRAQKLPFRRAQKCHSLNRSPKYFFTIKILYQHLPFGIFLFLLFT